MKPKVFVDISNIPELQVINLLDYAIEVGAAVTISKLIEALEGSKRSFVVKPLVLCLDQNKVSYNKKILFKCISSHLEMVASRFVRNTTSIGGNLIMAQKLSFDS